MKKFLLGLFFCLTVLCVFVSCDPNSKNVTITIKDVVNPPNGYGSETITVAKGLTWGDLENNSDAKITMDSTDWNFEVFNDDVIIVDGSRRSLWLYYDQACNDNVGKDDIIEKDITVYFRSTPS